mgnify:CR=1 FL=1
MLFRSRSPTPELKVDGVGDRWKAQGDVVVESFGKVPVALAHSRESLWVDFRLEHAELSDLLRHLAKSPETKSWTWLSRTEVGSLMASGTARVQWNAGKGFTLSSNLDLVGEKVRLEGRPRVDRARFVGSVTESGAVGELSMAAGRAQAKYVGEARWATAFEAHGDLELRELNSVTVRSMLSSWLWKPMDPIEYVHEKCTSRNALHQI